MSTTYEYRKRVTRDQQGSTLLTGQRQAPCEAWNKWEKYSPKAHFLRSLMLLVILLVMGVGGVWAAETKDFDLPNGYYFLGNEANANSIPQYDGSNFTANFYMCPAYHNTKNVNNYLDGDENKPLITTFKSFPNNGKTYMWAIWYIEAATGDNAGYFYIKHHETGKYMVANDNTLPTETRRRVNLGPTTKPEGNDGLFKIQSDDDGATYYIYPKEKLVVDKNGDNKYICPSNGNKDNLSNTNNNSNTGGILGFYFEKDKNSAWHFVNAQCATPTITFDKSNHSVTISTETTGATVYYNSGSNPIDPTTSSTNNGTSTITIENVTETTVFKAIAVMENRVNSSVASQKIVPEQTISLEYNTHSYMGTALKPTVTITGNGEAEPFSNTEYEVTYTNNTKAGTATVTITNKPGGNYYVIGGSVDFEITKASLTITVDAKSKTYGDEDPVLTYTPDGLMGSDGITGALSRDAGENVGSYAINQNTLTAGDNYAISYIGANLTINPKSLTVTANNNTITYGDAPSDNGVTYDGFVNSETESVLSGTLDYDYTYTQFGDVGNSYTITPSGLTATNYNITFDPGTLTVDQKEVGLDWSETTSFIYDGTSHCLTATATGMVNSDEIGVTVTGEQTNAGNYTATASELTGAKVGNYKLPAENTHSFTINPVELIVTANDHSITYGDALSGNGVTYDGFVNGETENVLEGTLAYTYSYSQYGDVGTYTITPKGLTGVNYSISYVNGTLTVNPKALAVTAEAKTKVYGENDPELTYTSVGLIGTDAITGALSRVYGEDVGTYDISQGTLAAPNYTITYTGANLTITQKKLTVSANPKTITYGDAPTNDGVTYSGFAYYENENFLLGTLAYAYSYEQYGNVGEYTITLSGLINDNYSFTYVPGKLTVGQKEVGLTWSETTSFSYDGTAHAPTATATGMVNNDEVVVTVSGDQIAAGNHIATASGLTGTKAGNYKLPADNTQGFTITKAALSVTATDNAITYGQAPSGNGVTYDGFVNGETESVSGVLEGTVDYDYNYTQFGDMGTYTITPKGLTSNNYDISFVAGTLTVEQKEVGLTWDDATPSFTYDGEEHAPTATVTGMVNNDAITVTVLGAQTNAGENYTATASLTGDKAGNYKLPADNMQSFTITPKSLVTGTTLASHYTLDFGEGNTILLTDNDIRSVLKIGTDYTVGNDTDPSTKYSLRSVEGSGNYTGSFSVRNAVVSFTTDSDQQEWSATFVAESSGATIGHALPEGVCAFIISGIEGEWAIPEPLNYIPEGVPVLLVAHKQINGFVVIQAESGDVTPTPITPDQEARNMLEEVTEATTGYDSGTESAPFATKQIYVLYKNEFVLNKAGNMKKGKVYLNPNHIASSPSPDPAPARLMIAWNDMTGIEDGRWKMEDGRSERWYTIDGRRLNGKPTTKGLYINNGNKVVIK